MFSAYSRLVHITGPLGLKANLDENDYLNVPERNDSERFFSLARKGSRRPFTDDEQDEFYDLFVRFAASLQNMAIDAQGIPSAFIFQIYHFYLMFNCPIFRARTRLLDTSRG